MSPTVPEAIIRTEKLSRTFGHLVAVRNVSLEVRRGEIFGILGPNGAGKSTTIRMLCGILDPSSGSGSVVGYDIAREPERIKAAIGYMTQRFSLYDDLTVAENLHFFAGVYGVRRAERRARVDAALDRAGLISRQTQITGTLSGGWKQRVALSCATIHNPPLLFLDEPTAGVDPVSRRDFWEQIHQLVESGTTAVMTTHYMDEAERCHRLAFIFRGALLDLGTPDEIVARRKLRVAELHVGRGEEAVASLRRQQDVEEVAHYGDRLRVCTHGSVDPVELVTRVLGAADIAFSDMHEGRATVEDAFVATVRTEKRSEEQPS